MTRANRITSVFIVVGLLISILAGIARAQGPTAARKTFTISGSTGLPGVTLKGFPGLVVSDENGVYSVEVPETWSGRVTPIKVGYVFQPPQRAYTSVNANHTGDDYTATVIAFTIGGSVGVPGAVMEGLPGRPVTDEQGRYRARVEYGWSGAVTPKKEGYSFQPPCIQYSQVVQNHEREDYTARVVMFTILGSTGAPGVAMQGLPSDVVTDATGRYAATVPYGWSGTVAPQKPGFEFTPSSRQYPLIREDCPNQDYTPKILPFTISGRVWTHAGGASGMVGVPDVVLVGFPGEPVTDAEGRYSATVEYGWSGTVVPRKEGFGFEPASREYAKVTADQEEQVFLSTMTMVTISVATNDVLVIPTSEVAPERLAETTEDLRVMLHIFREKLSEPRMILGVLRDYGNFFGADRKVEALYLQGTAAVFVIEVDFPYSFPRQRTQEGDATQEEAVDPVWQNARERLLAPPGSRGYGARGQAGQTQEMTFEQFKEELLRSLKHAANLRNLDPNELVILTIVAQNEEGGWPGQTSYTRSRTPYAASGVPSSRSTSRRSAAPVLDGYGRPRLDALGRPLTQEAAPPTTVLTMQAQKADIDAFAKGVLDFERFRQRVKTFTY